MAKRPTRRTTGSRARKPGGKSGRKTGRKAAHAGKGLTKHSGARARVHHQPVAAVLADLKTVATARQVFWSNVLREILVSLCVASIKEQQKAAAAAKDAGALPTGTPGAEEASKIFDGRLAVITSWGARLSLVAIEPVLGAGPAGGATPMSQAIECSVFQIRTTEGDVWTVPLHEIRAFHALTEELMQELQRAAQEEEVEEGQPAQPFGFKAFTSLSSGQAAPVTNQQPDYLGE